MSYSDYGGVAMKLTPNGWIRANEFEDATLTGITAPKEQPLREATGLKFDVLINAGVVGEDAYDWYTEHPHNCVLGSMEGVGLVGHKQEVHVMFEGKKLYTFPAQYDSVGEILNRSINKYDFKIEVIEYPNSVGCLMWLRDKDLNEYAGVTGYGIGDDHWWKNEDGREYLRLGDRVRFLPKDQSKWDFRKVKVYSQLDLTEEEFNKLAEDKEILWSWDSHAAIYDQHRLGFSDEDRYDKVIGPKYGTPWASEAYFEKLIREWVGE